MATLAEELILRLEIWAQQQGGREDAALIIEYEWQNPSIARTRYAIRSTPKYQNNGMVWTDEEVKLLHGRLTVTRIQEVAKQLGRSYMAVFIKAKRLGLKPNPEY